MNNNLTRYNLGELCRIKHGYAFDGSKFSNQGKYIILTPGNFYEKGGFKRIQGKEKWFSEDFPKEYLCKKNDLIVAMTQQSEGLLGSTALVPEDDIYLHNQRIGLVNNNTNIVDKIYLYYLFMTKSVRQQLENSASGTKVKHTSPDRIYEVKVNIPNINIQKKNAELLYIIDQKLENNVKICSELENMAKLIYDYWFVQFDFPDENGNPYRTSGGAMEWNDQLKREIPKGWSAGNLQQVGMIVSGGTPSTKREDYYTKEGVAWITPNDLSKNKGNLFIDHGERDITKKGLDNSSATLMPKGSVLLSSRAPIGYLAIAMNEISTNQGFKSIVPKYGYHEYYIYYLLKSSVHAITQQGAGTTFKEVSKDMLSDFIFALPTVELAAKFVQTIKSMCDKRQVIELENKELTKLRDWLLPMLMNGQVTVE